MDQETPKVAPDILCNLRLAAKEAVDCQSACNLSAVAHSFSRHMHTIFAVAQILGKGTDWWNQHPVCIMFSTQIAHLSGTCLVGCERHQIWVDACIWCEKFIAGGVDPDYTKGFTHVG